MSAARDGSRLVRRWGGVLVMLALALGCAMPGRLYTVVPAISGRVDGGDLGGAPLVLEVHEQQTPALHARRRTALDAEARFAFEAVELAVAGHEYGKRYRVFLWAENGGQRRILWRAVMTRRGLAGPIALDCELARPGGVGQPCRVRDPLSQPWLVTQGRRTYQRLCAECHGADGRGGGRRSKAGEGPPPPDLTRMAERGGGRFDREETARWIEGQAQPDEHGDRRMPIWGERLRSEYADFADAAEMTMATLDPVVIYLESIQRSAP